MSETRASGGVRASADKAAEAVERVGQKAGQVAGRAEGAARDTVELASAAGDFASAAIESGRTLISSAQEGATGFADRRKDDAAQTVEDLAASLRGTSEQFAERPNIPAFVGSAADGLDQLASTIRERSFAELFGEFERYARARPVAVGAASVAAGFLLARFIKSSSETLGEQVRDEARRGRATGMDEA